MFIPYNTDAPIYHWPAVTVCMIVANILAFLFELAYPEYVVHLALEVGNGLHPVQWLTNNFMHAGIMHLVFNMIFLWSFGLVVEGKLGPWKTLIVYLLIGVVYGATVQTLTLWSSPTYCLGASAVIYGFMAMCLIWAPENSMSCMLLIYVHPFFFDVSIKVLVGLYIGLDVLVLFLNGGELSTEFLHTVGAVMGIVAGIVLLKTDQVDCENWDIFSVWADRHRMTDAERARLDAEKSRKKKKPSLEESKNQDMVYQSFRHALNSNNGLAALKLYEKIKREEPNPALPPTDFLALIQLLSAKEQQTESIHLMKEYLNTHSEKSSLVRLKLARTYLETDQPSKSLKILADVAPETLDPRQQEFFVKVKTAAEARKRQMLKNGDYELSE